MNRRKRQEFELEIKLRLSTSHALNSNCSPNRVTPNDYSSPLEKKMEILSGTRESIKARSRQSVVKTVEGMARDHLLATISKYVNCARGFASRRSNEPTQKMNAGRWIKKGKEKEAVARRKISKSVRACLWGSVEAFLFGPRRLPTRHSKLPPLFLARLCIQLAWRRK